MKKLLFILILVCGLLKSQVKQIELRKCVEVGYASQGAFDIINEKCSDGNYKFSFRDMNYMNITIGRYFEFKDIDGSYENLFNSIIKGFDNPKEDIAFELPEHVLIISYETGFGIKGAVFNIRNKITGESGRSNAFLKGQIYKLFGFEKPKREKKSKDKAISG